MSHTALIYAGSPGPSSPGSAQLAMSWCLTASRVALGVRGVSTTSATTLKPLDRRGRYQGRAAAWWGCWRHTGIGHLRVSALGRVTGRGLPYGGVAFRRRGRGRVRQRPSPPRSCRARCGGRRRAAAELLRLRGPARSRRACGQGLPEGVAGLAARERREPGAAVERARGPVAGRWAASAGAGQRGL
jgi:hypothetical protein